MNKHKASFIVITAGIFWGAMGLFVNELSAAGLSSMQIAAVRMLGSALIFTTVLLLKDPRLLKIRLKDIWMFIGTGFISTTMFCVCYFDTVIKSESSIAVVLLYTSPIFVMLLSLIFFKERITLRKIAALIMTFLGCIFVAGILQSTKALSPLVLLTGIGAGFFYALYSIFGKFALQKYHSSTVTAYTFLISALPLSFLGDLPKTAVTVAANPTILLLILGICVLCTVMPYFLYTYGLSGMESGRAAILVAVEPLVGSVIGILFYNESHDLLKILGILLILSAIVVLNITPKKKERK